MVFPGSSGVSRSPDDGFRPSHVVPAEGLPAWEAPDPSRPTVPLDPFLPVQLLERLGDWGRVLCSNGWSAWVDGRMLVSVPPDPPAAGQPMGTASDPRPLLARAEEAVSRYRVAAEELAAGRVDGETFRRRTQGLRIGLVVDGEALWMYDARRERWLYCDGARLSTYATSVGPSAAGAGAVAGEAPPPVAPSGPSDPASPRTPSGPVTPASPDASAGPPTPAAPDAPPGPSDPASPDAPQAPVAPAGYEPTRVVEPSADVPAGREPTRVVDPSADVPAGHEPTRVVDHSAVPDAGDEPTRLVERGDDQADKRDEGDDADGPPDRTGDG